MGGLFICTLFGVACAKLGEDAGYSPILFFFLGFFFNIFGCIAAVAIHMSKKSPSNKYGYSGPTSLPEERPPAQHVKTCPRCGANSYVTEDFCWHCGESILPYIKTCPRCQARMSYNTTMCVNCGTAVPSPNVWT